MTTVKAAFAFCHGADGLGLDADEALAKAEEMAGNYSRDEIESLRRAFSQARVPKALGGLGLDKEEALAKAEYLVGNYTPGQVAELWKAFAWLHARDGLDLEGEEALDKAEELIANCTAPQLNTIRTVFLWACRADDGPRLAPDEALAYAEEKADEVS